MAVSNGIITAPVSISDVRQALGVASNDLGTLCRSSKINKWAKWKPYRYPRLSTNEADAQSVNYGLSQGYTIRIDDEDIEEPTQLPADKIIEVGGLSASYNPPSGGMNSPYRLTDFAGYNHNVTAPIYYDEDRSFMQNVPYNKMGCLAFHFAYNDYSRVPYFNSDIHNANTQAYIVAAVCNSSGTPVGVYASDLLPQYPDAYTDGVSIGKLPAGDYEVYACLAYFNVDIKAYWTLSPIPKDDDIGYYEYNVSSTPEIVIDTEDLYLPGSFSDTYIYNNTYNGWEYKSINELNDNWVVVGDSMVVKVLVRNSGTSNSFLMRGAMRLVFTLDDGSEMVYQPSWINTSYNAPSDRDGHKVNISAKSSTYIYVGIYMPDEYEEYSRKNPLYYAIDKSFAPMYFDLEFVRKDGSFTGGAGFGVRWSYSYYDREFITVEDIKKEYPDYL